jgi:hypothetical protein
VRDSDRWVTPRVVAVAIAGVVVIVLAAIGAVTFLSARGVDPAPMLKLVGAIAAGASSVLSLGVQLANRRTITKTERQAGRLATHVGDLVDVIDQPPAPAVPPVREYDTGGVAVGDPWAKAFLPPVPPPNATRPGRRQGGGPAREDST